MSLDMTEIPRTLVITHFPPGKRNGTARHLVAAFERWPDRMAWFSTKGPTSAEGRRPEQPPVPWGHGWMPGWPNREPLRSWRIHLGLGPWTRWLGRKAAQFARPHGIDLVWGALNLEAVGTAREAARILGVPLAVSAFDDPPTLLRYYDYAPRTRRAFDRSFERTLRRARTHGVISSAMAEDYRQRYGIEPRVLYLGVDTSSLLDPPDPDRRREPFVLGSIGSIISERNWWLLIEAAEILEQRFGREIIRLLHIGNLRDSLRHPRVEVTGWVTGDAFASQLERLDACFANIWFEEKFAYSVRTAFPTKISSYLRARRPVIGLGPADSLLLRLIAEEGLGVTCEAPEASLLADACEALLFDEVRYHDAVRAMTQLASTFSRERYFESVRSFLVDALEPEDAT